MRLAEAKARLEALGLAAGHFAVHGSGAMLARGLVDEVHDLDVVARGPAWRRACSLGEPRRGRTDAVVELGEVEIFDGWMGTDADALIDGAELASGLPCVRLEHVLAFKLAMNRAKDAAHIALLREHLAGDGRARRGPDAR